MDREGGKAQEGVCSWGTQGSKVLLSQSRGRKIELQNQFRNSFHYITLKNSQFKPNGNNLSYFPFLQLLGTRIAVPAIHFLNEGAAHGKRKANIIFKSFLMVKIVARHRFSSISEFQLLPERKLGCGSFGTVFLARHKSTARMYAVKMINVKELPSETELRLVEREIKLHGDIDHPHIARLWETLFDGDLLYLVLEYAERGNLFYHQNSKGVFSEPEAFKFFTQTLQAVHYLHLNNILHRDIKPENLLLDAACNIKLCDFGWSAEDKALKRSTFCGTYEYMAPEMLFKGEYDYRVDVWALGILLYEMLHGRAPFKGKSANEVKESMQRSSYEIGDHLSDDAKALISSILQFNPDKRATTNEIFDHPWLRNMETYINGCLRADGIAAPKEIHDKVAALAKPNFRQTKEQSARHRKNNSMNFFEPAPLQEELALLHYLKLNKPKKHYHSQEKEEDLYSKEADAHSHLNKLFLECTNKTYSDALPKSGGDKIKGLKLAKRDRGPNDSSKKKYKLRNSEVEQLSQKYPVRFNTEMYEKEDYEPTRLKKSNIKNKILANSKSTILKLTKCREEQRLL